MAGVFTLPIAATQLIQQVREIRFARGLACPRCDGERAVRWGGFSGRQRYRCRTCRRTFSDLTLTSFAYSKRLELWPSYVEHLRAGSTLRQAAADLQLHLSTSFRWRHVALRSMCDAEQARLDGWIELKEVLFAYSEKGRRGVSHPRRRGFRDRGWQWLAVPRARVAIARSRSEDTYACTLGNMVAPAMLEAKLLPVLGDSCTILSALPRLGPYGSTLTRAGHSYRMVLSYVERARDPLLHLDGVTAYARRLFGWIARFRGVATKYLDRYLCWHRSADARGDGSWCALVIGVLARTRPRPPTVVANTA